MLRKIYFFLIGLLLGFSFVLALESILQNNNIFVIENINLAKEYLQEKPKTILILGKPGSGYRGADNTDTIILFLLKPSKRKAYLISIPRDFLVMDEDSQLTKINSFYAEHKLPNLLQKIKNITGLKLEAYIIVDLALMKNLTDFIGGVDLELKDPIIDAASKFTLKPGKYHLNGDWAEFILRSRYAPEGDFARIRHQQQFLFALWQKINSLPKQDLISLIRFTLQEKKHWETDLQMTDLYKLWAQLKNYRQDSFGSIVLDFKTGLLQDGIFTTKRGKEYGIIPKDGVVKYEKIQEWLQSKIK